MGIGASAGGLEAFMQLLKHLPGDTGMGFVLVQHLDPQHASALAQLLARATTMPVVEVTGGMLIEPNHIYVIPPDKNLTIARGGLQLTPRTAGRAPHHSIDLFLESLAHDRREQAIGVVLSGTATDGTLGLEAIKGEGGITFAQDASAKYTAMPHHAVAAGCVDFELSPEEIARELVRIARHPLVARRPAKSAALSDAVSALDHEDDDTPLPASGPGAATEHAGLKHILQLVRNHSKVDFSAYKPTTIQRRINRRMVLHRFDTLENYRKFLRGNSRELELLYADMLICVTSFFRNPQAFELLKHKVFTPLLAQRSTEPVRVWVLGCSTGQEAYSIAMAFAEAGGRGHPRRKLQIFATDLNETLLEKARTGLYAKNLARDISPERLGRFFMEEPAGYRVRKDLRESVVFARQNVLHDPPFSHLDLISCRNLLIYIETGLQNRIMPMFHYALNPGGILFLGASESVAGFTNLFEPVDRKQKLFLKKPVKPAVHNLSVTSPRLSPGKKPVAARPPAIAGPLLSTELQAQREADRLTVNKFGPPGVLISDTLQVIQFRGPTGAYLEPARGKASFDVLKMAREGLAIPLRAAINQARRVGKPVRKERIPVSHDTGTHLVSIQVTPLSNLKDRCFLILFERTSKTAPPPPGAARPPEPSVASRRLHALETELAEVRDYLETVQEQAEAASGELQSANEEVTSANEELQSLNEELETSKEELESSNEELMTVNEEMTYRNSELARLNADLNNLHQSIDTTILVVSQDLTIRNFTPLAEKSLNILPTDLGRPLDSIRHNLVLSPAPDKRRRTKAATCDVLPRSLEDLVREVIATVSLRECEVRDTAGRWYGLKVRPYLNQENQIDGAVIMLMDIDRLKRAEQESQSARDYAEATLRTARDPLLVLHADLRVNTANDAFYRTFLTSRSETEGRLLWELGNGQWNRPLLRLWLEEVLPQKTFFDDFEVKHDFPSRGQRTMLLNARQLDAAPGRPKMILLGIEDVTDRERLNDTVRQSEERFRALTVASAQIVWTAGPDGGLREADFLSWGTFTGQTFAQARDAGVFDAIHPDDRGAARDHWTRCVADHQPFLTEYRLRRADGAYRWTAVHAIPLLAEDGSVREWIGTNTDITQRKEAEMSMRLSEHRYRTLFSSIDEGFCVIEMLFDGKNQPVDYRFLEINPSFEKQTGLRNARGRTVRELVPLQEKHWFEIYGRVATTGEPIRFVNEAKALERWFDVYAFPLDASDHTRVAVLFRDITTLRKDSLELTRVRDEALAASHAKDEFLAALSHELRTPLNPVLLLASVNEMNPDLPAKVRADFETIRNNIGLEARLIDDLLDLTRISSGKLRLELQACDVHTVLRDAIAIVRPDLDEKAIRLSLDLTADEAGVMGDPVRLQQVFWNILRNAIHFTPRAGGLAVATRRPPGETVVITITDTGSGIPPAELEHIFEAFAQGENTPGANRRVGGLGLGLAISRRMVELHAGSIQATSPGREQGSTFTITLPLLPLNERVSAPAAQARSLPRAASKPGTASRILLVDDHRPSLGAMQHVLEGRGYHVLTAQSLAEAAEVAREHPIDLLISDIGLPDGEAYGLLQQLQIGHSHLRGIALSGYGAASDVEKSRAAGFAVHLTKPVEVSALDRALAKVCLQTP